MGRETGLRVARALGVGVVACFAVGAAACSSEITEDPATTGAAKPESELVGPGTGAPTDAPSAATDGGAPAADSGAPATDSGPPAVTAAALLAKAKGCTTKVSSAPYAKDSGGAANVDVCGLKGAVFWAADMDIDCDGKQSTICNKTTDPDYQSQTATTDSKGQYLDAATLPYVVVPGVSSRWDYKASGVALGSVVAVIYGDKVEYGIIGDIGPTSIIGEASYAMAQRLGINPNPSSGGVSSGVTYIVFTNSSVTKKEDAAEARTKGAQRAAQLLAEN